MSHSVFSQQLVAQTEIVITGLRVTIAMTAVDREAAETLFEGVRTDFEAGLVVFDEVVIDAPVTVLEGA